MIEWSQVGNKLFELAQPELLLVSQTSEIVQANLSLVAHSIWGCAKTH